MKLKCLYCQKTLFLKQKKFCSNKCQANYEYKNFIDKWKTRSLNGNSLGATVSRYIRRYLFEKYENKCCKCGWQEINQYSNTIPLIVDHKDGNSDNCYEENLQLLCPNCDSLTSTYKALNIGRGRFSRRNRYKSGKSF